MKEARELSVTVGEILDVLVELFELPKGVRRLVVEIDNRALVQLQVDLVRHGQFDGAPLARLRGARVKCSAS